MDPLATYQFAFPGAGKGLPDRNCDPHPWESSFGPAFGCPRSFRTIGSSLNLGPAWPSLATDNPFPASSDKTDEW